MRIVPFRKRAFQHLDLSDCKFSLSPDQPDQGFVLNSRQKLSMLLNMEAYNIVMAILTVYSIFAIDIQKSFFDQPAAYIFGYIHILAALIFTLEMVLSWLGKPNYPFSFYFWIDIISTMSMLLEITWIQNFLTANSNVPAVLTIAKVVKASRLSRIGGRAAKMILMFLNYLKNKKAEEERNRLKELKNAESLIGESMGLTDVGLEGRAKEKQMGNEAEDFSKNQPDLFAKNLAEVNKNQLDRISEEMVSQRTSNEEGIGREQYKNIKCKESPHSHLLGKRRSRQSALHQKTFRQHNRQSKPYQITNIVQRLQQTFKLQPLQRKNVPAGKQQEMERRWMEVCQREEERKKQAQDKIIGAKQNFKLGEVLKEKIQKNIIIMIMSLIIILPLLSAETWFNKDPTIDQLMENYIYIATNITDPTQLASFLQQIIAVSLTTTSPIIYLQLNTSTANFTYPGNFPSLTQPTVAISDYMQPEITTVEGDGFVMVLNGRGLSQFGANINLVRSFFITVLLIFSTIIFMYSIESNALIPLEQMCLSINKISTNPFDALREINEKQDDTALKANNLETNILERAIWKMTNLLVIGAGEVGSHLILAKSDEPPSSNNLYFVEGAKTHGVFMQLQLANYQRICQMDSEDILKYINLFSAQIHEIVIRNGGMLIEDTGPTFLFFWKTPEEISLELERSKYFVAGNPLRNLGKTVETQRIIQLALRTYLQISIALDKHKKAVSAVHERDQSEFEPFLLRAGIHMGNGFQGSIGSKMKKQIKSISADVEFTKKLCRLAGQYGMSNIVSQQLCEVVDDLETNFLRKIDFVKELESGDVYWIYCWDFSLFPLAEVGKSAHRIKKRNKPKTTEKIIQSKEEIYKQREELLSQLKNKTIDSLLPCSKLERSCQRQYTLDFYETWNAALDHYLNSEWEEALPLFQNIQSNYCLGYPDIMASILQHRMGQALGIPPANWEKYYVVDVE